MTSQLKKHLIILVGPTAIGKTSLAIGLAQHFNTEIISADSRQFYREMAIGTAKPTEEELGQAKHHFVDFLSIEDSYSAGKFEVEALKTIDEIHTKSDTAILAGGSGLFVNGVSIGFDDLPSSEELRNRLKEEYAHDGIEPLQESLKKLDSEYYEKMDINNPQRLIRALEVCMLSGKKFSDIRKEQKKTRPFNMIKVGIEADREIIYERINKRVDLMMDEGLEEEVKSLLPHKDLNALNTLGYQEIIAYLEGKSDKETAIELIKRNSRRFAKRQLTWFKKDKETKWFDYLDSDSIIEYIEKEIQV